MLSLDFRGNIYIYTFVYMYTYTMYAAVTLNVNLRHFLDLEDRAIVQKCSIKC